MLTCSQCEILLEGEGPWRLDGKPSSSSSGSSDDDDVQLVFTPGHTAGCVSLLFRPDHSLLTGDHLAWSQRLQRLTLFPDFNWHSLEQQISSVAKLRGLDFLHVLPGHGRRAGFADAAEREAALELVLAAEGHRA